MPKGKIKGRINARNHISDQFCSWGHRLLEKVDHNRVESFPQRWIPSESLLQLHKCLNLVREKIIV